MRKSVFCLECMSGSCHHMRAAKMRRLTLRDIQVLAALLDPSIDGYKQIGRRLGISEGTMKVYASHINEKIGAYRWNAGGSQRLLMLWAIAHREQLGLDLPTPEQFAKDL